MGRGNYKKKYTYLNGIKRDNMEEIVSEPQVEEVEEQVSEKVICPLYEVQVTHPSLRRRSMPKIAENVIGIITDKSIYKIYDERDGWGQLEDGSWIMLQYTKKISE